MEVMDEAYLGQGEKKQPEFYWGSTKVAAVGW
jgi:hypothetical protein